MRCLLVSARDAEIGVLRSVLAQGEVSSDSSASYRAGVGLATVDLSEFDFAVVVLPKRIAARGAAAVLVEAGILVGRHVPVFLVDPSNEEWPALSGLPTVRTDLANAEALRFHLQLFVASLHVAEPPSTKDWPPVGLSAAKATEYLTRASQLLDENLGLAQGEQLHNRGQLFERLVVELLADAGALVEPTFSDRASNPDAAFVIPGSEQEIGPVVVEVKVAVPNRTVRSQAQAQLLEFVLAGRAGLGLLVYGRDDGPPGKPLATPRVVALSFEQLVHELRLNALTDVLIAARNSAIHGM